MDDKQINVRKAANVVVGRDRYFSHVNFPKQLIFVGPLPLFQSACVVIYTKAQPLEHPCRNHNVLNP